MGAKVREVPKGSGKYRLFIDYENQRKSRLMPSKKKADEIAKLVNAQIATGTFKFEEEEQAKKTVAEYAELYLEKCTVKPSTKSDYISLLKCHVRPNFGDTPVDKITRLAIEHFLKDKLTKDKLTRSTVSHLKAFLTNIFAEAYKDNAIGLNPASGRMKDIVGREQNHHTSDREIHYLQKDELSILLDAFMKYQPKHYALALLLARTGMRIGEAIALQWNDIDFDRRIIHVKRNKSRTVVDTPKSGKGRAVDMSAQLAEVLKKRRMDMLADSVKTGKRNKWVFPGKISETVCATAWKRRIFDVIVKKAGLPEIRVHDLRHTYASILISAGQPLVYISRQLGHSSISITDKIYAHLIPNADRGAVDSLDDERTVEKVIPVWKER
ncbi:MAG TPA: hypothetical protein DCS09_08620 [Porphyromonadaceae bacterium]|nr:hypothetical protein [Porphyromonadaceae bacterium]